MKRYGIFGGTFNPPHIAHLIHAESVREQMSLDKVIFVPSGKPPLKNDVNVSAEHRLNMAKIAFERDDNFEVSDIELFNNGEKTYTVDTLLKLREKYKNDFVKLFLIIGMDNLIDLHLWKTPGKLFGICEVIVINRPGYYIDKVTNEFVKRVTYVPVPSIDISSSQIRDLIHQNKTIKYQILPEVEEYILKNNLYKLNK